MKTFQQCTPAVREKKKEEVLPTYNVFSFMLPNLKC